MSDLYDGFDDVDDTILSNTHNGNDSNNDDRIATSSFNMSETVRPMTSNKSAGYSSSKVGKKNKISSVDYNKSILNIIPYHTNT